MVEPYPDVASLCSARRKNDSSNDRRFYLSKDEEEQLCREIREAQRALHPMKKSDVMERACQLRQQRLGEVCSLPSEMWWRKLKKRQPTLALRKEKPTQLARLRAEEQSDVEKWQQEKIEFLQREGIPPTHVFNMDETGIRFDESSGKFVVFKEEGPPRVVQEKQKGHIALVACVSAAGKLLPPYLIYSLPPTKRAEFTFRNVTGKVVFNKWE
jgi:hypothetical protein